MIDATVTTSALLAALATPGNQQAWAEIDHRYRPILISVARKAGLGDADADVVAQDALADLFASLQAKRYDRSRGRLRQWLLGICRLKIADARRREASRGHTLSGSIAESASNDEWTQVWEIEQRQVILAEAIARLRASGKMQPHTLAAFEMTALRNIPASEVAAQLGLTAQEVYLAKSRCLERIRTIIDELNRVYADDE